mmetsp:Transcript_28254/g.34294  ORF Transcript_28254/g.34294 Transcript_28254/m.34294 type:complete len:294 (-) Transcript_28254:84-965(-)|eukprot:CAMPEP_0197848518 /NCGR_PEP_ID=MMETSP1438-20131217/8975_1 /TAXON_ID=1461541 /ORGANISM="Pterosperma sp., Strain CCMP1384" /LENGTH=293 /DNA_ID=CAMNT_0043460803 /DNA_START=35 /DNA_END=916 /DNA_ORIENTATION=-
MQEIPSHYAGHIWEAITGPASTAGYFASYFTLAVLNNMTIEMLHDVPISRVVDWYQLSVENFAVVDSVWSAMSWASEMAAEITASLVQASTRQAIPGLQHPPATNLVYLAGHDTNLLLLRTLLQLQWLNEGWHRNNPPPGGMLVFELHRSITTPKGSPEEEREGEGDSEEDSVKVFFEVATPEQIRDAIEFNAEEDVLPTRSEVFVPGCPAIACPLSVFKQVITDAITVHCIANPDLRRFFQPKEGTKKEVKVGIVTMVLSVVGATIASVAVTALLVHRHMQTRRENAGYQAV